MDVRGALKEGMARLREASVPSPTLAAELLLMHTLGRDRAWLYAHPEEVLGATHVEQYFQLVARRIAGTPTQYLTGRQEFWGLEFEVTADVLIPRPETEHVVEVALERIGPPSWEREIAEVPAGKDMRIVDVGTGSGCLAVTLAHELPGAVVFASDVSAAALAVARRNAARHRVSNRIHFVQCNLLDAFAKRSRITSQPSRYFGLVVSNPPYVGRSEAGLLPREVREHEPQEALFAGECGGELYAPLIAQAEKLLAPAGVLVLELGYHALPAVGPLLDSPAWKNVGMAKDLAGIPRVIAAERA